MREIIEADVVATTTTAVVDAGFVEGYFAFAKDIYPHDNWTAVTPYPNTSSHTTFEAFKEEVRKMVLRSICTTICNTESHPITLKFSKVKLSG